MIVSFFVWIQELFKINNLSRIVDRLSQIYTVLTALDVRDDTMHLFIGPYHISLGPALFAAMHFRNASAALLVSSFPSNSTGGTEQQRKKRRREFVIRRFRRAVRKLTLVKSILNQLRAPSILIPYNQYELEKNGIYDLVLAERESKRNQMFENEEYQQRLHLGSSFNASGDQNPLLASNFIKINHLLNLLSSPQNQNSPVENAVTNKGQLMQMKSNEKTFTPITNYDSDPSINSETICCHQHRQTSPLITIPSQKSTSPSDSRASLFATNSRQNSSSNQTKSPKLLSRRSTVSNRKGQKVSWTMDRTSSI